MNPISKLKQLFVKSRQEKNYSVQVRSRGEELTYTDPDVELFLERTHVDGQRLYCDNTRYDSEQAPIPLTKRIEIMENLCDFFVSKKQAIIFVIDDADVDRVELAAHIAELSNEGHKVTVERSSADMKERLMDDMHLDILQAGKQLSIDGVEIHSVEEYEDRKKRE